MFFSTKSSASMTMVLISTLALAACSKNSDNKQVAAAPAPTVAQMGEVKQQAAKLDCPEFMGTYTNGSYAETLGEPKIFSMASVKGGVVFNMADESFIVDGQSHEAKFQLGGPVAYVASCTGKVLEVKFTSADGETVKTSTMKQADESGSVEMVVNAQGVGSTSLFKKVKDIEVAPETTQEKPPETAPAAATDSSEKVSGDAAAGDAGDPSSLAFIAVAPPMPISSFTTVDQWTPEAFTGPASTTDEASGSKASPAKSLNDMPDYYPDPLSHKHGFKGN